MYSHLMCPGPVGLPCINPRFCTYFPLSVLLYPTASVFLTFPVALGRILFISVVVLSVASPERVLHLHLFYLLYLFTYLTNWLQRYTRLQPASRAGSNTTRVWLFVRAVLLWLPVNSCFCCRTLRSVGLRVCCCVMHAATGTTTQIFHNVVI